jgi:hypothetical protein
LAFYVDGLALTVAYWRRSGRGPARKTHIEDITMDVTENYKLPSGGPFNLSPKVSGVILAHLEVWASLDRGVLARADARNKLIRSLGYRDAHLLQMFGTALASIGDRREQRILRDRRGVETRRQNSAVRRKKAT